jgi:predicted nucleic acid-binding protein
VTTFFDTSVLVAAFETSHPHHLESIQRLAACQPENSACALHTFAELYSSLTALPLRPRISPDQAALFIQEVRERVTPVELNSDEYFTIIREAAAHGLTSGKIYDALLLACAAKSKAQVIYTWNLKHFHSIAPHLADRIQNP